MSVTRWMGGPLQTRCTCAFVSVSSGDIHHWPSQPCWPVAAWSCLRMPSRVRLQPRLTRSPRPTTIARRPPRNRETRGASIRSRAERQPLARKAIAHPACSRCRPRPTRQTGRNRLVRPERWQAGAVVHLALCGPTKRLRRASASRGGFDPEAVRQGVQYHC
jgi:hypothetical protein